jgi:heat-inducible transcriptional repressor
MKTDELDPRSQDILRQAIHTFIASGEPVGSRTLAKSNPEGLSPATIRNIMSDLEETGYVYQPHTSAGRVPTDKGYRFYVSNLSDGPGLTRYQQDLIGSSLKEVALDVNELAKQTSRLLSNMTDHVSFVIGPDFQRSVLRHIDFVKLAPRRVLVVLVSQTGQVTNRAIELAEDLGGAELERCARYLMDEFSDHTLLEIREALLSRLREVRSLYNRVVDNALRLAQATFIEDLAPRDLYLEGTSRMLKKPEFQSNIERARKLLSIFEEKSRLADILNACLEGQELQIIIGSEARVPDLEGLSLIAARYSFGDRELGSLGIMGPTRMEYPKFISVVDYIAHSFSELISRAGSESAH